MTKTTLVSTKHPSFSQRYLGVPLHTERCVNAIVMQKKGLLNTHPIIKEFASADHTYMFSDSGSVHQRGFEEEKRLRGKVEHLLSENELTPAEAKALLSVYDCLSNNNEFTEMFPFALISSSGFCSPLMELLEKQQYDYGTVLKAVDLVNSLQPLKDYVNCVDSEEYTVHTYTNPVKAQNTYGKLTLPKDIQGLVHEFEKRILVDKSINLYIRHVLPNLGTYAKLKVYDEHVTKLSTIDVKVNLFSPIEGTFELNSNGRKIKIHVSPERIGF